MSNASNSVTNGNGTRTLMPHQQTDLRGSGEGSGHVLSTLNEVPDVLLREHRDLFNEGRRRAESSGVTEPSETDLQSLEEHARAMAREIYREKYDPASHHSDRLRDAEHEKLLADRKEAELAEKHATADVNEHERAAAQTTPAGDPPKPSKVLVIAAVLALALTIAPTMHDTLFITLADDLSSWLLSVLTASAFGVFVAVGILDDLEGGTARHSTFNWLALGGGITVVIGLALFRIKDAEGWSEIAFCLALTLVEIGVILALHAYASSLRGARQSWSERHAESTRAASLLGAATAHKARCQERLANINHAIASHINFIEERSIRHHHVDEIEAAAVKAARDGYLHGVSVNNGIVVLPGGKAKK
jgi:hypothetical protein